MVSVCVAPRDCGFIWRICKTADSVAALWSRMKVTEMEIIYLKTGNSRSEMKLFQSN